jgi:glycosyltransferase involved in cell wall biosynthesis
MGGNVKLSVILFSYNQQNYIEQAILSLLNQDFKYQYELIVSDDNSTDKTFDIIKRLHERYTGKVDFKINRNEHNLGLIEHFKKLVGMASSDFVVLAAGDDISRPNRVRRVFDRYTESKKSVICSYVTLIDKNNNLGRVWEGPSSNKDKSSYKEALSYSPYCIGATLAFEKSIMTDFPDIDSKSWAEDKIISFRAFLSKGVGLVKEPLVFYRYDVGVSSTFSQSLVEPKLIISRDYITSKQKFSDALMKKELLLGLIVFLGFFKRLSVLSLKILAKAFK